MRKKIFTALKLVFLITILGIGLYPAGTVAQDSGNVTIVIGTTDSISSLDPAHAYDYFSSNTLVQITHGLMEMPVDSTTAEAGPIVEDVSVNSEATVYTFDLRTGIQFSDGTPFNATAMAWNLERALTLEGDPGFLLTSVLNTSGIEVVDSSTLKLTLTSPDGTFLQRLTYTVAWPISPNSLAKDEIQGDPQTIPSGLGPYQISSWSKGTELILEPNPNYFGDAPANDRVIIKFYSSASTLLTALETGEVDVAQKQFGPNEMEDIQNNDNLDYTTMDTAGIRYLVLNVDTHQQKAVRQAMAAAVDRQEIVSTVFNNLNEELLSMVPDIFESSVDAFSSNTPNQNRVETLMQGAGYSTDSPYEMEFWYSPTHYGNTEASVAQLIKSQLESTGYFDITFKAAEWSTYVGQLSTMGFFLLGWWFDYPDASNYIDPFVGSGADFLGTNYSSSEMDGYLDTMLTSPDKAARQQAHKDAQNLIAEDVPLIPIFTMLQQFSGMQPNVEGYQLEPSENVHYNSITLSSGSGGEPEPASFGLFLPVAVVLASVAILVKRNRR